MTHMSFRKNFVIKRLTFNIVKLRIVYSEDVMSHVTYNFTMADPTSIQSTATHYTEHTTLLLSRVSYVLHNSHRHFKE